MTFGIRSIVPKMVAVAIACAGLGLAAARTHAEAAPIAVPMQTATSEGNPIERAGYHPHHRHHVHRHHRGHRYHHGHRHGHGWHHRRRHFDNHYPTRPRHWH